MADSETNGWVKVGGILGAAVLAAYLAPKVVRSLRRKRGVARLLDRCGAALDRTVGWDRLPVPLALFTLVGLRHILREENLYETSSPGTPAPPVPPAGPQYPSARTADGTYNDLSQPRMGSAGTRFGRNVPLPLTYPEPDDRLLAPSPRQVSLELLTRHTFQPASTLNLLAAAWIQFMIRDWLSHGKSEKENPWRIPLADGDDWPENPMQILRTMPDPTRTPAEAGLPPTHLNTETHWWDASQIYGNSPQFQRQIRTGEDGKLHLERDRLVHVDPTALVQQPTLAGWWIGLQLLFTLFVQEHNAICDRLRTEYPSWSDDALFEHARLINAALLAKIHTVEWTTAILGHPALQIAMRTNWWGLAGERIHRLCGRLSSSEVLSGIPGSKTDHFGVPYAITEEFVSVYRMHPLIPDELQFRAAQTDELREEIEFPQVAGQHAQAVCDRIAAADLFYSFGRMHPGAITLHNYPRSLQRFTRPDGRVIDLAAHDILRTRELGVPRYNQFRRLLHRPPLQRFEELTDNPAWVRELREVYEDKIERVDQMVGLFAERPPNGFGFSDTAFRIFILMASRRLNSDRFFTTDFTPDVYSPVGMRWIDENSMGTVLLRHYPNLAPSLRGVQNAFAPWRRVNT